MKPHARFIPGGCQCSDCAMPGGARDLEAERLLFEHGLDPGLVDLLGAERVEVLAGGGGLGAAAQIIEAQSTLPLDMVEAAKVLRQLARATGMTMEDIDRLRRASAGIAERL